MTISICIATHERAELLAGTLESIARQTLRPVEIVVSDSSASSDSRAVVAAFAAAHPALRVRPLVSDRSALPWQRWWACAHATGEWVLFLDDDVRLRESALETLAREIRSAERKGPVAGIGFVFGWDGPG